MGRDRGDAVGGGARSGADLVGVHEAAEIMGVDQQQVSAYERQRESGLRSDFPAPFAKLAMGPVWLRSDVEEFHRTRRRRRGPAAGTRALRGLSDAEILAAMGPEGASLTERERHVIRRRRGLDGAPPESMQDLAGAMGVSIETVSKTQRRAAEKIRAARSDTTPEAGGEDR